MQDYKPEDVEATLRSQKNADAFAALADELINEERAEVSPSSEVEQPNQEDTNKTAEPEQEKTIPKVDLRSGRSTAQEQAQSFASGPRYMDALTKVIGVADIRAIEVMLPIMREKIEVSAMTGHEEQALKTASVSPESFLKKLDELIYNHCTFESKKFSFNDFLGELYPPDKSLLIWALMSATYMVLPTVEKECASCSKGYFVDAAPGDLLHSDSIENVWDKQLPASEYTEVQTVLDDYIAFEVGLPSERDRLVISNALTPAKAKDNIENTGGLLTYMDNLVFFTKVLTVGADKERIVLTDQLQDIHPFLVNIPPKISDVIRNTIDLSIFDKYMPRFYLKTTCTHCKANEEVDIDPEIAFFRKAISL